MRFTTVILLLCSIYTTAQQKIATLTISDPVVFASVDRVGELYVVTQKGQIQKFDINGKLLSVYKSGPGPTLFEPRDGSRLFAFFREDRRIEYLDPSFNVDRSARLDSAFVIDPWLVCSSGDHNIWILDGADNTLKKFSPRNSTLLADVKFPENIARDYTDLQYMREYQGFLFFLDRTKGIHVFNSLGKWIRTITVNSPSYFNFLGEDLYYPQTNKLIFSSLFSNEQREMELPKSCKIALATDERLFLIHGNSLEFFEFKP